MTILGQKTSPTSSPPISRGLPVKPLYDDVALMRLPKKFSRKDNKGIILPDDYSGCPDLGVIIGSGKAAEDNGLVENSVVFFDMVLGREVTTDQGVIVFVHRDDIIAMVDTEGFEDINWKYEALKAQGLRGFLATP